MLKDRALIIKSNQAFVSFVRSYKEHLLRYIFKFNEIDLTDLLNSFFILRMPKIKETMNKNLEKFLEWKGDINKIPFKDKNYES